MPFNAFDAKIVLDGRTIKARGPKDAGARFTDICVWVFQHNGETDAAATEMTTLLSAEEKKAKFSGDKDDDTEWTLDVGCLAGSIDFKAGPAIGLAVALIDSPKMKDGRKVVDPDTQKEARVQKVLLWSQSIDLVAPAGGGAKQPEGTEATQQEGAAPPP